MHKQELTIAAKALEDNQIEKVLPGYKNIYKQIDKMKGYAKDYRKNKQNKDIANLDNESMHNVFSILGKRGSGKSSILLSLKKEIDKNEQDIILPMILPIILPEKMGNSGDMMGWILGTFKQQVENLSKVQFEDLRNNNDKNNFNNCRITENDTPLARKYNNVLQQYRYTREEYADILKENYSGIKQYIEKTRKILDPENELKNSFFKFIDELIEVQSKKSKEEPMVFIFLDDIDLTKNHCQEILSVISRYLCHPNIIVFISGDYNIFENEQFMSYMKSSQLMGLVVAPRENNILGQQLLEDNRALATDALKKIMPPAYRYKLQPLTPKDRLDFYYGEKSNNTLKNLLQEKFKELYDDNGKYNDEKNYKEKKSLNIINAYGLMFDDMPRGIMNVYYSLNNLENNNQLRSQVSGYSIENSEDEDKCREREYVSEFRMLIDIIIRSSSILRKYEDEIKRCIQINDKFSATFFNHERLMKEIEGSNTIYNSKKLNEKRTNKKEKTNDIDKKLNHEKIVVLIFAHFLENLVRLINKGRKIHGKDALSELLKKCELDDKKFRMYPCIDNTDISLDLYEAMLSNDAVNIMNTMDNIYLKDFSLKFYFEELEKIDKLKKKNIKDIIDDLKIQDSEWTEEKFKIIYYHKNPLCMMFNKSVNTIQEQLKIKNKPKIREYIKKQLNNVYNVEYKDNDVDINQKIKSCEHKLKSKLNEEDIKIPEFKGCDFSREGNFEEIEKNIKEYLANLNINDIEKELTSKSSEENKEENKEPSDANDVDNKEKNKIDMSSKEEKESLSDKDKICSIILYRALRNIHGLGDYEKEYFNYFEAWHQQLKGCSVYDTWCNSQSDVSPLTLLLENSENV